MGHRVVFVLPSLAGGGAERVLLLLMAALPQPAYEPHLVVFDSAGPLNAPAGVEVHGLAEPRLRRAARPLLSILRRFQPAAIVSTLGYVNLALLAMRPLLAGRPRLVVREANTPSLSLPQARFAGAMRLGYRRLYPTADAVLCQSRLTFGEFERDLGVPASRMRLLPNPVDSDDLRARAAHPERPAGEGRGFVAAGRLTRQKGFDRAIEALPAGSRLMIFGDGPDRAALNALAAAEGRAEQVRIAPFTRDLPAALAGADACLLPSRWEGQSNVALESLACGTPVVATPEAGAIAELAAEAPAGAVTIAPAGAAYAAALRAVRIDPVSAPRPSLLPDRYRLPAVAATFQAVLAELLD